MSPTKKWKSAEIAENSDSHVYWLIRYRSVPRKHIYLENFVCVLIQKLPLFILNGRKRIKRAQNYQQGGFKFINKLSLPGISKMADAFLRSVFLIPSLCKNEIHLTVGSIQPGFCWWRYAMFSAFTSLYIFTLVLTVCCFSASSSFKNCFKCE